MEIKTSTQIAYSRMTEPMNKPHEEWIKVKDIKKEFDEIRKYISFQFDKMYSMRLMYSQVKDIQDKHWNYLYLGNLVRITQILDNFENILRRKEK